MKLPSIRLQRADNRSSDIIAIHAALKGPVADVLAGCVPQLAAMPRDTVYDMIMDNPRLVDACFKLFRSQQNRFETVVTQPDGKPAAVDTDPLSCGRTLGDAITLVVRAVARRYFHAFDRTHTPRPAAASQPERLSAWATLLTALGLRAPPRTLQNKSRRAEDLFRALREFLVYEWQVPLIPLYAPLPVSVVTAVGPLLLLLREPEQIEALGKIHLGAFEPKDEKRGRRERANDLEMPAFYPPTARGGTRTNHLD